MLLHVHVLVLVQFLSVNHAEAGAVHSAAPAPPDRARTTISFDDVSVTFGSTVALRIESPITIETGDVVALLGPNGAGKSTFIDTMLGDVPFAGTIRHAPSPPSFSVHFQRNEYNDLLRVRELIALVLGPRAVRALRTELGSFDLLDLLAKRLHTLSGGERQRLTAFLVLRLEADVYVLDECTSGLDLIRRRELMSAVRSATAGRAVIVASHNLDDLDGWANKVLLLNRGRMVFWGSVDDFEAFAAHRLVAVVPDDRASGFGDGSSRRFRRIPWGDGRTAFIAMTDAEAEVLRTAPVPGKQLILPNLTTRYMMTLSTEEA